MRYWVGNTDDDWAAYLRAIEPPVDEVNFWQPGGRRPVTLQPGDLRVFKRKVSLGGQIIGGAWYVAWSTVTPRLAWDAFATRAGNTSDRQKRNLITALDGGRIGR